jgi:hypothetical protein
MYYTLVVYYLAVYYARSYWTKERAVAETKLDSHLRGNDTNDKLPTSADCRALLLVK